MLDREERTVVRFENDKAAPQRLTADIRQGADEVALNLQTPETTTSATISRASLRALADFLSLVADDVDSWEDDFEPVEPDEPATDEGTVD